VTPRRWAGLAFLVGACGTLALTDEGAAFLEIIEPPSTTVAVGDTIQFTARTLDKSGAPVQATIRWRTPDTTISVIAETGQVVGRFAGTARVQAVTGTEGPNLETFIASDFFTVTVTEPPAPPGTAGISR
jgi:uncharacterized protein YjdB